MGGSLHAISFTMAVPSRGNSDRAPAGACTVDVYCPASLFISHDMTAAVSQGHTVEHLEDAVILFGRGALLLLLLLTSILSCDKGWRRRVFPSHCHPFVLVYSVL